MFLMNNKMGQFQSKVKCIYRLAQSGKTQLVSDIIQDCKMCVESFGDDDYIHFFITSNNQVLVGQTGKRFGNSYNWVSANKGEYSQLRWDILHGEYSMTVMCSNRIRLNHLVKLINELEKSPHFTKKINIWIDEADASINLWTSYEDIVSKDIVDQITLVSATFGTVFKRYTRLQVIGYKDPHPKQYRCLRDSIKIVNDFGGDLIEYIDHIFELFPKLTKPGNRGFIPGTFFKLTHDTIAEHLKTKHNFAVLIINGSRKEIIIPGKQSISLKQHLSYTSDGSVPDEFKNILSRMYIENKLYEYPFAITGLECVKRGITFQSNDFLFNFGIIPAISKKAEAYQLMARLFGNIGEFSNYKPCEIYTYSSNFKKIEKQEAIAMNISTLVFEQNLPDVGLLELNEAANMSLNSEYQEEQGGTFLELKEILQTKWSKSITKRAIHTNTSGILVSTTYGQPAIVDKNSEDYKNYNYLIPTILSIFKSKSKGSFLSNTRDWVVIPVYTELTPGTEKWFCRFKKC